ncbi:MAG: hypothetical protein WC637_08270 [Victivallales bacterium]|jgi:hypothetical protein
MSAVIEKKDVKAGRDLILAVLITVMAHLALYFIFILQKPSESKVAPDLKKVVFLPLDKMPESPVITNLVRWLEYGDPTLISKPNQKHGFSSIYHVSGLRSPESDLSYGILQSQPKIKISGFEKIILDKDPLGAELAKISNYKPAPIPQHPYKIQKKNPPEYPCWRKDDGETLPQLFSNADEIRKKIQVLRPEGKTVLKVTYYGGEFQPRPRIHVSCGNRELDSMAVNALIAKTDLLPSSDRKTDEPCYIEIEWQKGQSK